MQVIHPQGFCAHEMTYLLPDYDGEGKKIWTDRCFYCHKVTHSYPKLKHKIISMLAQKTLESEERKK